MEKWFGPSPVGIDLRVSEWSLYEQNCGYNQTRSIFHYYFVYGPSVMLM